MDATITIVRLVMSLVAFVLSIAFLYGDDASSATYFILLAIFIRMKFGYNKT